MAVLAVFLSGLLFGLGLVISGLANPGKVLDFFDIAGAWDPSLIFTMAGAVLTTAIGYRAVFARNAPFAAAKFHVPTSSAIDAKLLIGAALFGIGWGLVGYCPGPALTAIAYHETGTYAFLASMLAGMWIARILTAGRPTFAART